MAQFASAPTQARWAAERCGQGAARTVQTIVDDQWTVHEGFAGHRPLHRVPLDNSSATVLYVSSRTGEVVQRTTRAERGWNWIGSVPHWIYPTAIRRHWALWDALVWWLAAAGVVGVCAGLVLGLAQWRRSARSRISPYQGALYWHHVSGLGIGLVVFAWIFSGSLSMDHGRLFSTDAPTREQQRQVAGTTRFEGDPRSVFSPRATDRIREGRVAARRWSLLCRRSIGARLAADRDRRPLGACPWRDVQQRVVLGRTVDAGARCQPARAHRTRHLRHLLLRSRVRAPSAPGPAASL